MKKILGINETRIDRLILDISDYNEQIRKNLLYVEQLVDSTKDFFQGECGNLYRNNFLKIKTQFSTINNNFQNYSRDLNQVKNKYNLSLEKKAHEISNVKEIIK